MGSVSKIRYGHVAPVAVAHERGSILPTSQSSSRIHSGRVFVPSTNEFPLQVRSAAVAVSLAPSRWARGEIERHHGPRRNGVRHEFVPFRCRKRLPAGYGKVRIRRVGGTDRKDGKGETRSGSRSGSEFSQKLLLHFEFDKNIPRMIRGIFSNAIAITGRSRARFPLFAEPYRKFRRIRVSLRGRGVCLLRRPRFRTFR